MKQISANITGSIILNGVDVTETVGSSAAWSGSLASRVTSLEVFTGSMNAYTASINDAITGINAFTSSANSSIAGLNSYTSSNNTTIASLNAFTSSANSRIGTLENVTASYATTASNSFNGNQTVTGSLVVTGQVIAQTLNVQQVTSSVVYSSGSNVFGNSLANTHQFTGSLSVTGSLTSVGQLTVQQSGDTTISIRANSSANTARILFNNASTSAWALFKDSTTSDFRLYNYSGSAFAVTVNYSTNAVLFGGSVTAASIARTGGTSGQFLKADGSVDGTSYATAASISGTTNYIPKFTSAGAIGNSALFDNSGNIGIGTTTATEKFVVFDATSSIAHVRTSSQILKLSASTTLVDIANVAGDPISFTVGTEKGRFTSSNFQLSTPINGTSLSMSGIGLFNGATDDGTNKLIVNGGVKGGAFTGTTATFLSSSSTVEALIVGGAGGAGSTRQGQLKFGDAGTVYKIQGGEDYSALNFIIGSTTVQSLASNGAATFSSSGRFEGDLNVGAGSANYFTRVTTAYNFPYVDSYFDSYAGASYEGRISFRTNSGGGAMGTRMTILNNGNVGIGITNPTFALSVAGIFSSYLTGGLVRTSNNDAAGMLHIRPSQYQDGYITFTENAVADRWAIGITAGDSRFFFRPPYPTSSSVFTISGSGNVAASGTITSESSANGFEHANGGNGLSISVGSLAFNRSAATGAIYNSGGFAYQWQKTNSTTASSDYLRLQVYNTAGSLVTANALQIDGTGAINLSSLGTGTVYSNSGTLTNTNPSDRNLKTNITPITYGLQEVLKLNPVSYNWKDDTNTNKQFGFIAQEVQEILPDAVIEGEYLGLEKDAIYASLVNAIKELTARIEQLENK